MATLIITEKTSQARDLRAALGDRFGRILPAEGHLLRLAEPEEINPAWKKWSCALLKPEDLYPTRPDTHGNKPAKLKAIAAALRSCDQVIVATDCDREGQLIGQEILEHCGYRGRVMRALFTAQDPKTLHQAFTQLKPNDALRPLYESAVARRQADQIFNLSLTRTTTKTLLAPGTAGVIGIGRVKTPTLAIVCLREREIIDFHPETYFEVVATATVSTGTFEMRHAQPAKNRLKERARAEAVARAADGHRGPLTVTVEERRQGPPRLFDLPALQKLCGQRWGWTADRTLALAQELYDGDRKKLITYPRAEARYLSENQIADVPVIVGALTRLRGFAHLEITQPVIRRGRSGHFCDQALAGVAHHAIVPNVNVMDDLESRLAQLSDDEKRLYAVICRSYLAAVMPDYQYRQTEVSRTVPVPDGMAAEFRAVGHCPLRLGWKAVFGATGDNDGDPPGEAETLLPALADGDDARLSDPRIEAKQTRPPPRYHEGTLVEAMQNAWRFVEDPALRERLKEAKGIGTPATRADIIKGLRQQNLLGADGKWLLPTPAGLQVFDTLRAAAPALVDPGTTAVWEMRLDEVATGRADARSVIDGIAAEAQNLIEGLRNHQGTPVDLGAAAPKTRGKSRGKAWGKGAGGRSRKPRSGAKAAAADPTAAAPNPASRRPRRAARSATSPGTAETPPSHGARATPTPAMLAFARSLAQRRGIVLPDGCESDFGTCRRFLDQHT